MYVIVSINHDRPRIETCAHVAELAMNLGECGISVSVDYDYDDGADGSRDSRLITRAQAKGADFIYRIGWNQWTGLGMNPIVRAVWRLVAAAGDPSSIPAEERDAMKQAVGDNWRSIRFPSVPDMEGSGMGPGTAYPHDWSRGPITYDEWAGTFLVPRFGIYRLRAGGGPLRAAIQTFTYNQSSRQVETLAEFVTE